MGTNKNKTEFTTTAKQAPKPPFYNDKSLKINQGNLWEKSYSPYETLEVEIARVLGLDVIDISLDSPENSKFGDLSLNIALKLAKEQGKNPRQIAEEMKLKLEKDNKILEYIKKIEIAGAGFINFYLKTDLLLNIFSDLSDKNTVKTLKGKRIMLEFAHPNPFKAFHIGHLRNIILGESLVRLLEFCGAEVIRTNYQGDVGMHIAKCLWAFSKVNENYYPTDVTERVQLIAKCYTDGAKAFENEKYEAEITEINKKIYTKEDVKINKLWELGKQWSLDKFHMLYKRVDSSFVREYMESETLQFCTKYINEAKEKGILELSDGALVFKGEKYDIDTRVFLNSEGLPTYEGKELGLASMEFSDYGDIDLCIHNVAVEQISFFKVTFKVESLLNPILYEGKQYHNAYEFVGLKSGKMSSRTGNVVLGEDIINEAVKRIDVVMKDREGIALENKKQIAEIIGVGAIKYSFLNISPSSYLAFDLEKSLTFEGNSGPYIQYTYTRANKVITNSNIDTAKINAEAFKSIMVAENEKDLLKKLLMFNKTVLDATKHLAPNILCNYLFELSKTFNNFYKFNNILKEKDQGLREFRILLTLKVRNNIKEGLRLLGIGVPESM